MDKNIDDTLIRLLNKESLNDEEKRHLDEWSRVSNQNKKIERLIQKLECQRKVLDKHQKQETVFAKIERKIYQTRKKRRLIFYSSCAAGIMLLVGILLFLQKGSESKRGITNDQTYIAGLSTNRPVAELILPNGKKHLLSQEKETVIVSDSSGNMRADKQTLIVESSQREAKAPEYYTINIPLGAEYNLSLPDGTKIYLNAGSSLRYPDRFTGKKREVFLTGEAYFEVTPDSLHPFTVQVTDVEVQVLGTTFNVNAYPEGAWIKTTLVEGRVETRCGDNRIIMSPGTQVAYNKESREAEYFHVNTLQYTSWKDGYYDFEDMPLEELMQIFSRWYNVKIEFAKPDLREIKFSGRLKRYDDLRPLFEMLEYTRDIQFIMGDDKIIIQHKLKKTG